MKTSTSALTDPVTGVLYAFNVHRVANLYTLAFPSGTKRWTSARADVSWSGNTWDHDEVTIQDEPSISSGAAEVDGCEMTFAPGAATVTGSVTYRAAVQRHMFDRVPITIERAYYNSGGTVAGLVHLFGGWVQDAQAESTLIRLRLESLAALLREPLPRRLILPQCPYQVYDTACGLTAATYTDARTVAAGSSKTVVVLSSSSTRATASGWIEFTDSGTDPALYGLRATVLSVAGTSCTLTQPLPSVPVTGGTINVVKGCQKTRTDCRTFGTPGTGNIARFGGFPDAPPPEAND